MNSDQRHKRLEELFHLAGDLDPEAQRSLVQGVRREDPALAAELAELLSHLDSPEPLGGASFFERIAPNNGNKDQRRGSSDLAPSTPESIGGYRIVGMLGSGGMGAVYRAIQPNTGRFVALKTLRPERTTPELLQRFEDEIAALARLKHPGITQIYDAGVAHHNGVPVPFFAMELVSNAETLTDFAHARGLPLRKRLELFAKVCHAIEAGHREGLIHRDLKPDNILVDGTADKPEPKIIDFGVARTMGSDKTRTMTGELIGTLQYMSPDQLAPTPGGVGVQSDVYTLGLILFELVTGQHPYDVSALPLPEAIQRILEGDHRRLSTVDPSVPRDVEVIVAKALATDPARRYVTAARLAEDLDRHLSNRPILARPPSLSYKLQTLSKRHRTATTALVATLLVAVTSGLLISMFAQGERRQAELLTRQQYVSAIKAASEAVERHEIKRAENLLEAAPKDARGWEWLHLQSRLDESLIRLEIERNGTARLCHVLEVSPNGLLGLTISSDVELQVWSLTPPFNVRSLPIEGIPIRARFTADGSAVVLLLGSVHSSSWEIWVEKRLVSDLSECTRYPARLPVEGESPPHVDLDPSTLQIVVGFRDHVLIYDLVEGHIVTSVPLSNALPLFGPDGRFVAVSRNSPHRPETTIEIRDPSDLSLRSTLTGTTGGIVGWSRSAQGRRMLTIDENAILQVWDTSPGTDPSVLLELGPMQSGVTAALSPDGNMIAGCGVGESIQLWDVRTGELSTVLHGHRSRVGAIRFVPDTNMLISTGASGGLRLWDLDSPTTTTLNGHASYVYPVHVSQDGSLLISGGWDGHEGQAGSLRIWDTLSGESVATLGHPSEVLSVRAVDFALDDQTIVLGLTRPGISGEVVRVGLETGLVKSLGKLPGYPISVATDPTGLIVAVTDFAGTLRVLDIRTGRTLFEESVGPLSWKIYYQAEFSPDGKHLAVATDHHRIQMRRAADYQVLWEVQAHKGGIGRLLFSEDGKRLTTVSEDETMSIWDVGSGAHVSSIEAHGGGVLTVARSPDGSRLATGGRDGQVRIWSTSDLGEMISLTGHKDYVYSLAWSSDGARLYSGSGDGTIRVWDTQPPRTALRNAQVRRDGLEELEPRVLSQLSAGATADDVLRDYDSASVEYGIVRQALIRAAVDSIRLSPKDKQPPP